MVRRETKDKMGYKDLKGIVVRKETLGSKGPMEMLVKREEKVSLHLRVLCVYVCMHLYECMFCMCSNPLYTYDPVSCWY